MNIKILSWNIWCDCHFEAVSAFLRASQADIIGLQEVSLIDPERDVVSLLKNLGYECVTGPAAEFTDNNNRHHVLNTALFSKFPIIGSKIHPLRAGKRPSIVEARIQVGSKELAVFSVHLKHTHQQFDEIQNEQVKTIMGLLPPKQGIIMGDFNAIPDSTSLKTLTENYVHTDPTFSPTWSMYPEGCPVCKPNKLDTRLDYILVSPDIAFTSPEVGASDGSDHLPISISIKI